MHGGMEARLFSGESTHHGSLYASNAASSSSSAAAPPLSADQRSESAHGASRLLHNTSLEQKSDSAHSLHRVDEDSPFGPAAASSWAGPGPSSSDGRVRGGGAAAAAGAVNSSTLGGGGGPGSSAAHGHAAAPLSIKVPKGGERYRVTTAPPHSPIGQYSPSDDEIYGATSAPISTSLKSTLSGDSLKKHGKPASFH